MIDHYFIGEPGVSYFIEADGKKILFDDSALVYQSPSGLIIITGCSHAGICNIVDQSRKICHDDRVVDIIGGFHLLNPPKEQLQGVLAYMKSLNPDSVHACHCTDLNAKIELSSRQFKRCGSWHGD